MQSLFATFFVPHEYNTIVGRRIQDMKNKALTEDAQPVVDYFFEMASELAEDGIEKFECAVCSPDDLYERACRLEDLGAEWCANNVGVQIDRISATSLWIRFAKRTDPAPYSSPFNGNKVTNES